MTPDSAGAASTGAGRRAVVFFGVPEREVDDLIGQLVEARCPPVRWFLFGRDMNLLGALDQCWHATLEPVVACLPRFDAICCDAALTILEHEGETPRTIVWVHGNLARCPAPDVEHAIASRDTDPHAVAAQILSAVRRLPPGVD
jgi:hypothetical protein